MTRLRRKLNSMFCNKVNFIFTRELSYSCCGNHHFESLDFGAFKFSAIGLHRVAYFAWTFNLLHNVAWLPWTWKSCQKLTLQPHDFPSLLPFPSTYNTVQRNTQGTKMIPHFILKLPAWGGGDFLSKHRVSGNVNESRQCHCIYVQPGSSSKGIFGSTLYYSVHMGWPLKAPSPCIACAINHVGMHSHISELIGAWEKLSNFSHNHIKPRHL